MKTTMSWNPILNKRETYFKELQEAEKALVRANQQLRQIPSYALLRYALFLFMTFSIMLMVYGAGFVTWERENSRKDVVCTRVHTPKPTVNPTFSCTLPKTWASLKR